MVRHGGAWLGMAWHGGVWFGGAGHCAAMYGTDKGGGDPAFFIICTLIIVYFGIQLNLISISWKMKFTWHE